MAWSVQPLAGVGARIETYQGLGSTNPAWQESLSTIANALEYGGLVEYPMFGMVVVGAWRIILVLSVACIIINLETGKS